MDSATQFLVSWIWRFNRYQQLKNILFVKFTENVPRRLQSLDLVSEAPGSTTPIGCMDTTVKHMEYHYY